MLAEAKGVGLINEPTNPGNQRAGVCPAHFSRFFTYITPENDDIYVKRFGACCNSIFSICRRSRPFGRPKTLQEFFETPGWFGRQERTPEKPS